MSKAHVVISDLDKKYDNPIAELVQVACQFSSSLHLIKDQHRVNIKSILGIMAINPSSGMEVEIEAEGNDESKALTAIEAFLLCR